MESPGPLVQFNFLILPSTFSPKGMKMLGTITYIKWQERLMRTMLSSSLTAQGILWERHTELIIIKMSA